MKKDSTIIADNNILRIANIVEAEGRIVLICRKFYATQPLYMYPINSPKIGINFVKNLRRQLHVIDIETVTSKAVLLPHKDGYAVFPFIHSV